MTPERWRQIEQLYHSALDCGPADRSRIIDEFCAGDEALRREVESLLAFDDPSETFMDALPGDVVAGLLVRERTRSVTGRTLGRYRVLSPLGVGSMGEVFLAEDTQLNRRVAIKVLRPDFTRDRQQVRRFQREAHSASALNHPNIVTIFEFGEVDDFHFIATEFVDGQSLQQRISVTRFTLPEALDIAIQVASALRAAHSAAIVHRDIKPGNIMLRPDGYVKVVDFGLAKLIERSQEDAQQELDRSQPGWVMGTPRYMSPEQVLADRLDGRSDIFSLGVVLYELVSGSPPFQGSTASELTRQILTKEVPPLGCDAGRVSPELARIVAKALAKDREHRYQTAGELQADLGNLKLDLELEVKQLHARGSAPTEPVSAEPKPEPRPSRAMSAMRLIAFALALVVAFSAAWFVYAGRVAAIAPVNLRRSIAVLGFKNLAGRADAAWVSTALSEWFAAELAAGGKLRIVPGEAAARMKADLPLAPAEHYAALTLDRIQQYLGADYVLAGSYLDLGGEPAGEVRLDLLLQDAATGTTLASVTEKATEAELPLLVAVACQQLRQKLSLGNLSTGETASLQAAMLSNREAARQYSEGLEKLWAFDAVTAQTLLEKAVAAEPAYAPARSTLAVAWSDLGYEAKAQQEAKKALELTGALSREDRLTIEGRFRETNGEWAKAVETYRTLRSLFPDNLDYGTRLANAQTKAGNASDARSTVDELRKLPQALRDDPRVDLADAAASDSLADYKRQQATAESAAAKADKRGIRLLLARARLLEGDALANSAEADRAIASYEKARLLFSAAGDLRSVADILERISTLLRDKGDVARSSRLLEDALAVRRQSGDQAGTAGILRRIGFHLVDQGDLRRAKTVAAESLQICTTIGDRRGYGAALNVLARVSKHEGALAAGCDQYRQALAIFREFGAKAAIATLLGNIGEVLMEQGELESAAKMLDESHTTYLALGQKIGAAATSEALGDVLLAQGDVGEARKKYEEAVLLYNQAGPRVNVNDALLHLASLALEDGRFAEAANGSRGAAEALAKANQTDSAASGYAILARALSLQGNLPEARKAMQQAVHLSAKSQGWEIHFEVRIAAARVRADSRSAAEIARAITDLTAVSDQTAKFGFLGYHFDAQLALGEIGLRSGHAPQARARLAALAKNARQHGFALISRQATALTDPRP